MASRISPLAKEFQPKAHVAHVAPVALVFPPAVVKPTASKPTALNSQQSSPQRAADVAKAVLDPMKVTTGLVRSDGTLFKKPSLLGRALFPQEGNKPSGS